MSSTTPSGMDVAEAKSKKETVYDEEDEIKFLQAEQARDDAEIQRQRREERERVERERPAFEKYLAKLSEESKNRTTPFDPSNPKDWVLCDKPGLFGDFEGGADYGHFEEIWRKEREYNGRRRVRRERIVDLEAMVRKREVEEQAAEAADKGKKVEVDDAPE